MSPDTITALDAVQEAATALATAVMDAKEAFNPAAPADPTEVKVGDVADTKAAALALLDRLPEGARVTDRDGDSWTKTGDGRVSFRDDGDSHAQDPKNAASYFPLTVTSLPAAEEAAPLIKGGDKVRITGPTYYGFDYIGQEGTVIPNDLGNTPEGCAYVSIGGGEKFLPLESVELVEAAPEPEPTPIRVEIRTTDDRDRIVNAEPGILGEGSAFIAVSALGDRCGAWLSRDEARQLAATLTAIADS